MRQINKAIYILIEKYHRIYGLEFFLFSHGSFGAGYWGFQIAANRTWVGNNKEVNDADRGKELEKGYSLTSYQDQVSIPSWAANVNIDNESGQPTLSTAASSRTQSVVDWLEKNMQLENYFARYSREIAEWRIRYGVEDSEKYILMTNIVGLLSQKTNMPIRTPNQFYESSYGGINTRNKIALNNINCSLNVCDQFIDIFGVKGNWVCRNGLGLFGSEVVDFWEEYINGRTPKSIVAEYAV